MTDDTDFVSFGDVARGRIGQQCQYAVRYLEDRDLSIGIRWTGDPADYHFVKIHKDDVELFVQRVQKHRSK